MPLFFQDPTGKNEDIRIKNENDRLNDEKTRVENEKQRIKYENIRTSEENTRIEAEKIRKKGYNDFITAMGDSNLEGTIEAEVIGARGKSENLRGRLDNFDLQFSENINFIKKISNPITEKFPVVTFVDDDTKVNFFNIWKSVCDNKSIKISLGVVPDWIENQTNNVMTKEQLTNLYNEGFDILSHTWSHNARIFKSSASDLSKITDNEIKEEFYKSKDWLINNGYGNINTLVYPWGDFGTETLRYKRIARHFYTNAINASGDVNNCPNDNMYLDRVFINVSTDISIYKSKIDNLIGTNNWLIFGTHSNTNEINSAYLLELVEYIQAKNIPILTFKEALKYKENSLSIGEYTNKTSRLFISKNGEMLHGERNDVYEDLSSASVINSKWMSDKTRERIVKNNLINEVECHICFTNSNKTGSYVQDEIMLTIPNLLSSNAKSYVYQGTIITWDSQVITCYFWVNIGTSGLNIKMVNNSTVSNIRWIFMNFKFSQ